MRFKSARINSIDLKRDTKFGLLLTITQAQAPPDVLAMMAQGDADNLARGTLGDRDRATLFAMKAWIESRLTGVPSPQPEQLAEQVATPASTMTEKIKDEGISTTDGDVEMLL
jgi:hypothetical protein